MAGALLLPVVGSGHSEIRAEFVFSRFAPAATIECQ